MRALAAVIALTLATSAAQSQQWSDRSIAELNFSSCVEKLLQTVPTPAPAAVIDNAFRACNQAGFLIPLRRVDAFEHASTLAANNATLETVRSLYAKITGIYGVIK